MLGFIWVLLVFIKKKTAYISSLQDCMTLTNNFLGKNCAVEYLF